MVAPTSPLPLFARSAPNIPPLLACPRGRTDASWDAVPQTLRVIPVSELIAKFSVAHRWAVSTALPFPSA